MGLYTTNKAQDWKLSAHLSTTGMVSLNAYTELRHDVNIM